jgi:hypothetical protein
MVWESGRCRYKSKEVIAMRKKEMREVEVKVCDFCGDEATNLETCCICGKEGCLKRGKGDRLEHWAYHVGDVYSYKTGKRGSGHVCKECGPKTITLDKFLDNLTE